MTLQERLTKVVTIGAKKIIISIVYYHSLIVDKVFNAGI